MHCVLVVPGTLDAKTGGTIYDRKIVEGLIGRGWTVDVRAVGDLPSLPPRTVVLVDGLAYAATPGVVERESSRLHVVALVHLPLALEPGLSVSEAARLRALEQRVLASVSRVVVTGRVTVDWLREYGISRDRIALVEPGTDRAP